MMNRRQILATGAACVALAAPIPGTAAEKLSLGEISRYLNGITTASGDFTQINDDGTVSKGRVIIKRPGRVRFEYAPPDRTLVVSDGSTVGVIDGKSNEPPQGFPLNRTPLSIILARNVDLTRARMVTGHRVDGAKTIVQAQDPAHPEYGNIELVFTGSPVELRQWIINDGDGARTTVVLGGLRKGGNFSNDKFVIPGLKPGAAKDR